MERSTVRKVIRAASLSLLLATATGVAGVAIVGASPAMAQQDTPGGTNPAPGFADPGDPSAAPAPSPSAAPAPGGGIGGGIVPDLGNPAKAIGGLGTP